MKKSSPESFLIVSNYSEDVGYAWNNIYNLFKSIAKALNKLNVKVIISFPQIINPHHFFNTNCNIEYISFDIKNPLSQDGLRLLKHIKNHNIKYLYLTDQNTVSFYYFFLRVMGIKKIIVHNRVSVPYPYLPKPEKGLRRIIKIFLNTNRFISADYVYAVSKFVKFRLAKKNCIPNHKIRVIYNGVDINKFNKNISSSSSKEKIIIFSCGRATKHKGIHILIQAASILITKYKINNFVIKYAGDGPDLDDFTQTVSELNLHDNFCFLGKIDNTANQTSLADIVVVPSIWGDACPSTVIEAMAAGKALITTDCGGIPELVGENGDAIVVPPNDADILAKKIYLLVTDVKIRKRMGIKAKKRAIEHFTIHRYHSDVINNLIEDCCLR